MRGPRFTVFAEPNLHSFVVVGTSGLCFVLSSLGSTSFNYVGKHLVAADQVKAAMP